MTKQGRDGEGEAWMRGVSWNGGDQQVPSVSRLAFAEAMQQSSRHLPKGDQKGTYKTREFGKDKARTGKVLGEKERKCGFERATDGVRRRQN